MIAEIQFGELPIGESKVAMGAAFWRSVAYQLRQRPGHWALVLTKENRTAASVHASRIRKGTIAALRPAGAFESASRDCGVWVRFVGGES